MKEGDIRYLVRDLDGTLEAWLRATSVISFMEVMVNKEEKREKGIVMSRKLTQDGVKYDTGKNRACLSTDSICFTESCANMVKHP